MSTEVRTSSYGESERLSVVDRFGTWLSRRRLRFVLGDVRGATVADIGCGYDARFGMSLIDDVADLLVVDVSVSPAVSAHPRVTVVIGVLPAALESIRSGSVRHVVMNSVLEHLDEPVATLRELRRITDPSRGVVFVNVPTWLGKRALEASAFRLRLSPAAEIEDHRRYYSKRELWMSLREAGFMPSEITVRTHKFGLNVYGVCRRHG
jgi:2-polyprenyl-3-methyl-5-hydroxy-6-metoxy-1,4-benzoquinol methylase